MRQSHVKPAQLGDAERTVVREKVNAFLRARHPHKTAEHVCAATGISINTVEKWLVRGSAPTTWAYLRLMAAYGPDLLVATMEAPPAWLDKAAREERRAALRAEIAALEARLEGDAA